MSIKNSNLLYMLVLIIILVGEVLLYSAFPTIPIHISTVLIQFIFILVPSVLYILFSKTPIKSSLRLNRLTKRSIFITFLIALCSFPLVGSIGSLSELFFHNHIQDSVAEFPTMPLALWIGILAITPSICEEVFMRGVVLSGYKNISIKKAALMNGFLFGMFHMNLNQFVYTFVLGVILAYTVSITNSLFSSIIVHFIFNSPSAIASWSTQNSPVEIEPIKTLSDYAPKELITFLITNISILAISAGILVILISYLKKANNYFPNTRVYLEKEKVFTIPICISIVLFLLLSVGISFLTNTPV